MTQPSKAAMERANELIRKITPENVLTCHEVNPQLNYVDGAFCRFIDTVDRVARDCLENVKDVGGLPYTTHILQCLMLPDEPDPLEEFSNELAQRLDVSPLAAKQALQNLIDKGLITAAGYEIVKKDDGR
ncbi:hypothetical protein [Novosphingobium mathurense]|uniref:Uncharacterized protein n=1 Tax=Novosphingobium mathurense TaxID=428990 RepID=A0A1U6I6M1_9SPHN|nr:hypothetical protein [Novosphingobium mathurense]SLK03632.1 hypothetical protein SAMN06295987_104269 [Novosphingobium mathurense]